MALPPNNPVDNFHVYVFNPLGGTPGGERMLAPSPVRGRVIEAGFMPDSLVASAITLSVLTSPVHATASNFTEIITSTLGTFSSAGLYEGAVASVVPPSPAYVGQGDAIKWVTSGGNTSAIGLTCYAIIKRG